MENAERANGKHNGSRNSYASGTMVMNIKIPAIATTGNVLGGT